MYLEAIALSDVGRVRQNNEDNYYIQGKVRQNLAQQKSEESYAGVARQSLFAVADGMGGESDGEIASLVSVQSLRPCGLDEICEEAYNAIVEANEIICNEIMRKGGKRMGSTLTALYMDNDTAVVCNIGDSRAYLMRDGIFTQISEDHTIVQQMVNIGAITKEEARTHKKRHVLSQNIGIFPDELVIEPTFSEDIELKDGDLFLLCSDGLTDMLTDDEIREIMRMGSVDDQAHRLVEGALENGGRDNITVILVKVKNE